MVPAARMRAFVTQVGVAQKENARLALVATARGEEARVIREQRARSGGIAPTLTRIVDGRRGASYETVRANGVIILQWSYIREIVQVAVSRLKARGPEQAGDWKKSITVFADDAPVSPTNIPALADFIQIAPTVPYSRRLEIGEREDGKPFVISALPHLVEEAATFLRKDYAGVAVVKHSYVQFDASTGGATEWRAAYRRTLQRESNRRRAHAQTAELRYPAIQIWNPRR